MKHIKPIEITLNLIGSIYFENTGKALDFEGNIRIYC